MEGEEVAILFGEEAREANDQINSEVRARYSRLIEVHKFIRTVGSADIFVNPNALDARDILKPGQTSTPRELMPSVALVADGQRRSVRTVLSTGRLLMKFVELNSDPVKKPATYGRLRTIIQHRERESKDIASLWLSLTDAEPADPKERLNNALAAVDSMDLAGRFHEGVERLIYRSDHKNNPPLHVRDRALKKARSSVVDYFAHAVLLSVVKTSGIEDDCACPICRNSYIDFHSFAIEDLVADYPVKIRGCGHIIGKACLETWMKTPLADPAKYPFHTCPVCRTEIPDRDEFEAEDICLDFHLHIMLSSHVQNLIKDTLVEQEICEDGMQRLMSEEIALQELRKEIQDATPVSESVAAAKEKAIEVMEAKLQELCQERAVWGLANKNKLWEKLKAAWGGYERRRPGT